MCGVDGRVGWAPPSYLKKCEDKNESDESDEEFGAPYSGKKTGCILDSILLSLYP